MARSDYRDILELFEQGAAAQAEAKFLALRAAMQDSLQQRHRARSPGTAAQPELQEDGAAYVLVENGRRLGRFCRHCFDSAGRLERLQAQDSATFLCPACRTQAARKLCG